MLRRSLLVLCLLLLATALPATASATVAYLRPIQGVTTSTPWAVVGAPTAWQALDDPVTESETPSSSDYISANVSHSEAKSTEVGLAGLTSLAGASGYSASAWFYTPSTTPIEIRVYLSSHQQASGSFSSAGWHSVSFSLTQQDLEAGDISLQLNTGKTSGLRQVYASFVKVSYTPASPSVYWGARMDGDVALLEGKSIRGDAPWDSETWNLFEEDTGNKAVSIVHFGQPAPWEQAFATAPLENASERGAIPLMSMSSEEVSLAELAKVGGGKESSLRTWLKAVKNYGKPFFFRWDWEMNGTWFAWGKKAAENPKDFVAAWRRFHDMAEEEGATNITWVWCPNVIFSGSTELSQLYPGDEYVDWVCMDGYNRGTNPLDPIPTHPGPGWIGFEEVFSATYTALQKLTSKPIMIAETASSESGGSKAGWIKQAIAQDLPTTFPAVKAFVWFNWNILDKKGAGRWDWPIETSSTAEAAFAQEIASPYYTSNSYGSLPPLKPIQPLP